MCRSVRFLLSLVLTGVISFTVLPSVANTEIRAEWYNGTCPKGLPVDANEAPQKFSGVLGVIAAAIVPKLVSGGVDIAAKTLQAAGEDRPSILTARTDTYFYNYLRERKNALNARCLIVVEAENFNNTPVASEAHPWRPMVPRVGSYQNARVIFMAAVDTAPEGKLFRLVPAYLEIKDWRERSFWSSDRRDYTVAVTLTGIGQATHFASLSMSFKGVKKQNYTLMDSLMNDAVTEYVPLAPLSSEGAKHISTVESAWASKDRAASILDAKLRHDNEPADRAAGKIPPEMPNLYNDQPYFASVNEYCATVREANREFEKAKREIPTICNWKQEYGLALVSKAKKEAERKPDWLAWAQLTCWSDPKERAEKLKVPESDGYQCAEPKALKNKSTPHTRVAALVVVTEVIEGSRAAKYLGDALGASAADVSKVINEKLPSLSKESRDAADFAERALQQSIIDADFKVELAENELSELAEDAAPSKVTEARMKRQAAWYAANNAYRAAGRTPPYPEG